MFVVACQSLQSAFPGTCATDLAARLLAPFIRVPFVVNCTYDRVVRNDCAKVSPLSVYVQCTCLVPSQLQPAYPR